MIGCLVAIALMTKATGQTPIVVQGEVWTSGIHHYTLSPPIVCPGDPATPVSISAAADALFISAMQVHITEGFHAGGFNGYGSFHAYVDPTIITNPGPSPPTVYQNGEFTDIESRTIDLSKAVGAIVGSASNSNTGSANYTIPVPLPPGTNSIAPNLAITYDSRGRDGLLGTGWALAGTSTIVRSGKDFFYDQANTPIQYGPNDRFLLDGQRLVLTGGSAYGAAGSVYDTENASFAAITAVGTHGNGPSSFTMVTKDGITMEYGTNASTIRTTDDQEVLIWRLSRVRDAYGNTVSYTYGDIDGEPLLLGISYTTNDAQGLSAFCTVRFEYSYRSDPGMTSLPRRIFFQRHLLDRVTATVTALENGSVASHIYRSLELKYALRDIGNSYLTEVVEHGRDNAASLNSTIFQYGDQPADVVEGTGISIPYSEQSDVYTGDYDGDGRSDVLRAYYTVEAGIKRVTQIRVYPTSGGQSYFYNLANSSFYAELVNSGENYQAFTHADFNGDGKDDICVVYTDYWPSTNQAFHFNIKKIQIFLSTPSDFLGFSIEEYNAPDPVFTHIINPNNSIQIGDFDGDGKFELIMHCVTPNDYPLYKLYMLKAGIWSNLNVEGNDDNLKNPDHLMVVDVNGDRKHDLMAFRSYPNNWNYPNTCSVFSLNGAAMENISTSAIPYTSMYSDPGAEPFYAMYPGDFNGDGNTDLLVNANLASIDKWRIYFSDGTGYSSSYVPFAFSPLPAWPTDRFRIVVADFNGDGRSDICHSITSSGWGPYCKIYYSLGHTGGAAIFNPEYAFLTTPLGTLFPCDQNGDGRADIISFTGWNAPLRTVLIRPEGQERLIRKVANGLGAIDEFVYGQATTVVPLTGTVDRTWPIIRTRPITDLVLAHNWANGNGGENTTTFSYNNPYFQLTGRGFMGFGTLLSTEGAWQLMNTFTVQETKGLLLPETSKKTNGNYGLVSQKLFSPAIVDVSSGRFMVQMPSETAQDLLSGTGASTARNYDNYGNVTQATVTRSTVSPATTVDVEIKNTAYDAYGPSTVPAKPTLTSVLHTRTGAPQVAKTTKLEYNAQGAMFRSTDFFGTPKWVKTEFSFNGIGLVDGKTVTTAASGANGGQSESYTYDPTARFVTTKQFMYFDGAANWITQSTEYDLHRGLPTRVTGADGLKTDYTYDAFDHLLSESVPYLTAPDPARTITHALEWDLQAPAKYYRTSTQDPAQPDVTTWYDQLGRQTGQQTETFGGAFTTSTDTYDALGRQQRVTAPHLPGEPEVYEDRSYDAMDRLQSSTSSIAGTTTFGYSYESGLSTVTTTGPAGHVTETTKDCTGLTVSSTDDGGTLTHTYDSWGNLLTTKHGTTTIISNTYDAYGRQTQLTDAAAGTTGYSYDAWGRLVHQEDANGNAIDLTYDNLGRLKTKGDISYTYYHEGGRFADLPASTTEGAASTTYAYDELLRLNSQTKVIAGETFTTQYTYDDYDNVATMQYPSGTTVGYTYVQHCFLDQVTYGAVILYDAVSANGQGQITSYALGDGKTTHITYTDGRPTHYFADGVQDLNMAYDPATGNLNHRWDKLVQRKESFSYDALDRLAGATVNQVNASGTVINTVADLTYTYDGSIGSSTAGDLIQRTDIGKFNYSQGHAPSDAFGDTPGVSAPEAISQATQTITYTSFLKAATIAEAVGSDAYLLTYTYGTDHQRAKSVLKKNGNTIESRFYVGAYEEQRLPGITNKIHYVNGPGGLCAMIVQANGTENIYYVYNDHLGSPVTLTKGQQGGSFTVEAQQNFDAWGRRRNPADWTYTNVPAPPTWLYRGYTGHEHVEPFALVNMNGRMYDPLNGRMLSADNYIQGGLGSQGYNRYSYAGNNPLKYTDPDGQNPLLIGALIGGFVNWLTHGAEFSSDGLKYFAVGAVAGLVGAGVGGGVSSALANGGFWAGAAGTSGASAVGFGAGALAGGAGGGAGGFLLGFGNSAVAGNSMNDNLNAGLRDGAYGALTGGLAGGIQGGIAANRQGANFWTGTEGEVGRGAFSMTPNKPREADHLFWVRDDPDQAIRIATDKFEYAGWDRMYPKIRNEVGLWQGGQNRTLTALQQAKGKISISYAGSVPSGESLTMSGSNGRMVLRLAEGFYPRSSLAAFNLKSLSIFMSGTPISPSSFPAVLIQPPFRTWIQIYIP